MERREEEGGVFFKKKGVGGEWVGGRGWEEGVGREEGRRRGLFCFFEVFFFGV